MQHNKAAWRTGLQLDGTPAHDEHYDDGDYDDLDYAHEDDHDHDRDHDQDQEDVDNSDPMR